MNNTLSYKGYTGSIEYSKEDNILYGRVLGISSLISYEGESIHELIDDFHGAIDDYLTLCAEDGSKPEIPYKGSFNVRLKKETHRDAAIYAIQHQQSLNSFIEEAVQEKLYRARQAENESI